MASDCRQQKKRVDSNNVMKNRRTPNVIETERTLLRPIELRDSEQVFAYRSDAVTNRFQGWIPKSLAEVEEFVSRQPSEFNQPKSWSQLVFIQDRVVG